MPRLRLRPAGGAAGAAEFLRPDVRPALGRLLDRQEHDADYKDRIFADILGALGRRAGARGALLDVGAHAGRFLRLARDAGWDAEGLELNPKTAAYAAEVSGAVVHQGNIHTFTPSRCYDAVTLTDVLEHVPQPLDVLRRVRTFLCAGGWLSIKVPNGPAQRVKETLRARLRPSYRATLADNLVHVNHFSAASLARALTSAGLRDVTVGPAAPELSEGPARQRASHWGRLAAYRVARALPGGAASPLAFNLQAYGRRT